ncbi:MinD/ParA family protein [Fictibacillus sp. Mic-4]|uniref:MinD/ParA family protein n=1 Tax=Fictibacillus sp. Mic-4 TaxID=3132826 RepID=UPI003CEFF1A5
MIDQAENLRRKLQSKNEQTKVISVVSGKGGVGKTNFSINFSLNLVKLGKKVLLFDLDIGMANVDLLLGMKTSYTIVDIFENRRSIREIIEKGPSGLDYIAGGSGLTEIFQLGEKQKAYFISQLEHLNQVYDFIIFDLGAGISETSLRFILSSNEAIVITTPEITSLTDSYAMIKYLTFKNRDLPIQTVINQCENEREGRAVARKIQEVSSRFLNMNVNCIGYLPHDVAVQQAVKAQQPFALYLPGAKISKSLEQLTRSYIGDEKKRTATFSHFINKIKSFLIER